MTIIPETQGIDNAIQKRFAIFIKRFGINAILRSVNATKLKGIPSYSVFSFMLGLVFTQKNLYTLINSNKLSFGKDVIYRFISKSYIRWEAFIRKLSCAVISEIDKLSSEERRSAWVLDDTPYYRDRSKKVELLSRCYDHSEHRYYKGFNLLNMGWTDGQTFIPSDFRLLCSGDDKNLLRASNVKDDKRTLATKRRNDARSDKPALALVMLEAARHICTKTRYVIFDSWFASPKFILSVKKLGFDIAARLKNHENYRYLYAGKSRSLNEIYKSCKKRRRWPLTLRAARPVSRYLLSVNVQVRHKDFDYTIPARIVFVRDKNNRKKWIALISTDVTLSDDEIVALYGKRWDIEPFHKMIKSYLRLAKEFQVRSFDALVAHTAIVLTRYIFLSLENRENRDQRSLGELFFIICDELEDISFQYAFALIISTLEFCLSDYLLLSAERIDCFVQYFIAALPAFIRDKLCVSVCES